MQRAKDRVWIVGASDGIGAALAQHLARNGHRVAVSARRAEALEQVRASLSGDGHLSVAMDVTEPDQVRGALQTVLQAWGGVDRTVNMAGAYTPMRLGQLYPQAVREILDINLGGAFHVVEAVLPEMLQSGRGQIALCGSIAGYRGLPRSQPYGATKAGLINLAESLRAEHGHVLDVKVINPGFVRSRLTDKNEFRMPALIGPEEAAEHIAEGLYSTRFEIHFPRRFSLVMKIMRCLPHWAYFRLLRRRRGGAAGE